jgi:1,2-diacylglycerol 3-alpha-glucosyltransferase
MKIAFFTDSFFPHVDGVTTYIGVITRALLALGHEVMILATRWKGVDIKKVEAFVPGAEIVLVPGVKVFFYPDLKLGTPTPKSFEQVRKFAPDVIHFHTPSFMGFEATLLARLLKVPLITTFHTYYMEPEGLAAIGLKENGSVSKMLQESLWKISESVHKPCAAVIAPTEYVGKDLHSRWKKVNVQVIPGAVELSAFGRHMHRNILRKKFNLDNNVVFLSSGRLSAEKHYDVLITAFSMILMKHPSSRLVFVGGGPAREELEYIVKVLGIERAVVFVGEVPYKELTSKNYYSMGDIFVSPSTWDTQGLSVVEAMASGLPVVAFNYRAMPEVIGKGGILVKHLDQYGFAKAMGKLAGNTKLRENLGKLAANQSKKYNIGTHVKSLLNLYTKLIED